MADPAPPDVSARLHMLDRLARTGAAPWLHGEVARRMAERLPVIRRTPQRVLDWWGFLGHSADVLAHAYPKARRLVVEPTPGLVERSRAAVATPWWSARRWTGPGTDVMLERDVAPASAELLWANMMLHASPDAPTTFAQWRRALAVDGFLMFSTLGPDTLVELRGVYERLGWPAPTMAFTDMHDIGDAMVHAGFADPVMDQEHLVLTWASPDALLDELRALGRNTHAARAPGLRTPRWRARLCGALQALAGPDGRLRLSFEIVYGHAFNPAPRARVASTTEVSLEQMRAMVRSRPPRAGDDDAVR